MKLSVVVAAMTLVTSFFIYNINKVETVKLVQGILLKSDNTEIAILPNEEAAKKVLEDLKEYYIKSNKLDISQIKECRAANKITCTSVAAETFQIKSIKDTVSYIIKENSKLETPLVTISFICDIRSEEKIAQAVIYKNSNELLAGQSKVQQEGKEGIKSVLKEMAIENNKVNSITVLQETIVEKPKDKIIVKGLRNPDIVKTALLTSPSRGKISSNFGMRWGRMHNGIDIAANLGTPIYAALDGIVCFSGYENGYGNIVRIKHSDGLETAYGHCSKLYVSKGKTVKKGDLIAAVGSTGNSTGPHVHFEVKCNGVAQNPINYIN